MDVLNNTVCVWPLGDKSLHCIQRKRSRNAKPVALKARSRSDPSGGLSWVGHAVLAGAELI